MVINEKALVKVMKAAYEERNSRSRRLFSLLITPRK